MSEITLLKSTHNTDETAHGQTVAGRALLTAADATAQRNALGATAGVFPRNLVAPSAISDVTGLQAALDNAGSTDASDLTTGTLAAARLPTNTQAYELAADAAARRNLLGATGGVWPAEALPAAGGSIPATEKNAANGVAPLDGSVKVPAVNLYAPTASALLDFRQMSDRPATAIVPQQGAFVGLSTATPEHYAVVNGRFVATSTDAAVVYPEVRLNGVPRHLWGIIEVTPTLADLEFGAFFLMGIGTPPSWQDGSPRRMIVHAFASLRNPEGAGGAAGSGWQGGSYNIPGTTVGQIYELPNTNPAVREHLGKTRRFDITFDPTNARFVLYIDLVPVGTYIDTAVLPYLGTTALFEIGGPGVAVVEFGASTVPCPGLAAPEIYDSNGFSTFGPLSSTWGKLKGTTIVYPPSGKVVVSWSPRVISTSGVVEFDLGPFSATEPDGGFYKQIICSGAYNAPANFRLTRQGVPGTREQIAIFGRTTGVAELNTQGTEGIWWQPVLGTTVTS